MKFFFTLLALLSIGFLHANYEEGTVIFKDHSQARGLIKFESNNQIKFKKDTGSKVTTYNYQHLKGFNLLGYHYRYLHGENLEVPILLRVLLEGEITLYKTVLETTITDYYDLAYQGFDIRPYNQRRRGSEDYFVEVNDQLFHVGSRIKKKDLQIINCSSLTERIKKRTLNPKNIYSIISYYNQKCGQEDIQVASNVIKRDR